MSTRVKLFLFLSGCWIFFAFGFRLYILYVRWETDPFRLSALVFALIFILIGTFLIRMGCFGGRAEKRHYRVLFSTALFIVGFWAYRFARLVLDPQIDPNPRAHLHLSATFLAIGFLLLIIGLKGGGHKP